MRKYFTLPIGVAMLLLISCTVVLPTARSPEKFDLSEIYSAWVDIGGYKLYIRCVGKQHPAVIMDAGAADTGDSWREIPFEVARQTGHQVCVYDRAGLGRSDLSPNPRTSVAMVEELRVLLRNAAVKDPPYILVGHSFGGLNMRLYASMYPNEVVGLVLVDASHEDQITKIRQVLNPSGNDENCVYPGTVENIEMDTSMNQVRSARRHLGNLALIVISHGKENSLGLPDVNLEQSAQVEDVWRQLQNDLVSLSDDSQIYIVDNAGHHVHQDQPTVVIKYITQIITQLDP